MKERLEMIRSKKGLPAPAYSSEFWEALNTPNKRVMDRVVDRIVEALHMRRSNRLLNLEVEKALLDDSHYMP